MGTPTKVSIASAVKANVLLTVGLCVSVDGFALENAVPYAWESISMKYEVE